MTTHRPERAQGPDSPDVSTGVLLQMARDIGSLTGTANQMNERMGELAEAQRSLATGQEQFSSDNAHQHRKMSERLASMESRLGDGDRRFTEHQNRIEALEQQRKKPSGQSPDSAAVVDKLLDFGKKWWPGMVIFFGAIYTALERYFRGGSQ